MSGTEVIFVCTQMEAAGVQTRAMAMKEAIVAEGSRALVVFLYRKRQPFRENDTTIVLSDKPPTSPIDLARLGVRLFRVIQKEKPRAVVGMAHYASPIAAMVGFCSGVRYRIATQTNPAQTMPRLARVADLICGSTGLYSANVTPTQAIAETYRRYPRGYRKSLSVIPNGVPKIALDADRAAIRSLLRLDASFFHLVACGRLSHQKNHRFLIDLMPQLPNCVLHIIGEGELRADLTARIQAHNLQHRVHLHGELPRIEVARWQQAADLFVFPSLYEAFGLALIEAMSLGTPAIAADHPAITEVLGATGKSIPLRPDLWIREISRLSTDRSALERMSAQSLQRSSSFTFEAMLDGFRKLWGEACGMQQAERTTQARTPEGTRRSSD